MGESKQLHLVFFSFGQNKNSYDCNSFPFFFLLFAH